MNSSTAPAASPTHDPSRDPYAASAAASIRLGVVHMHTAAVDLNWGSSRLLHKTLVVKLNYAGEQQFSA
jgi:hypothetical protein